MFVFFADLDNTLIYSHHHPLPGPGIVAERIEGREQSFMLLSTYERLSRQNKVRVIPVTTRTELQYRRIDILDRLRVKYALICNGGKLLVDGKEDTKWTAETVHFAEPFFKDLEKAVEILKEITGKREIHRPEPYMAYVVSDTPKQVSAELNGHEALKNIDVRSDHRKVYLFIKGVDKGQAVRRFRERFINEDERGFILAAGDNQMDIPMFREADLVMAPERLISENVLSGNKAQRIISLAGEEISEQICDIIDRLVI